MQVLVVQAAAPVAIAAPTHCRPVWEVGLIRAVGTLRGDLEVMVGEEVVSTAAIIFSPGAAGAVPGTVVERLLVGVDREGSVWAWGRMAG